MVIYCCVPGCKAQSGKGVKMHRFPKNDKMHKLWINAIQNPLLCEKDMTSIQKTYRVCHTHFGDDQQIEHGRRGACLKLNAVPTLILPRIVLEQETNITDPIASIAIYETPSSQRALISASCGPMAVDDTALPCQQAAFSNIPSTSRKGLQQPSSLLKSAYTSRTNELPSKAQHFYKMTKTLRKTARRLDRELAGTKRRLKEAYKFSTSENFLKMKLNKTSANFVLSQIKQQGITPKGRRYSLEEKILALALLKQSPKGYKFCRSIFALPSKKTLNNILQHIPFEAGINEAIFQQLKTTIEKLKPADRYCTIVFDEISLEPSIHYNQKKDKLDGFQDNGPEFKSPILADKAMVFMARGIHKNWKQPLAFYFNKGGMKADMLAKTLKDVIRAARLSGLQVIASVCDQGAANRSAINTLYEETDIYFRQRNEENRLFGFVVDGIEVVPLFDPPHLLKCIRNLLFEHDVVFEKNGKVLTAKWNHIAKLVSLDNMEKDQDYRMLQKINQLHVNNKKKMKVAYTAQIFSKRVASLLRGLARLSPDQLPEAATETAEFVLFMDKTFDSVNGTKFQSDNDLRCAVSENSQHHNFWIESIKVFQSMKFLKSNGQKYTPPTVTNWIHTLKGFRYLWKYFKDEGFKFLSPRNFNQDPLENYFGGIRSHGIRNINPSCQSFVNSFKTLLINNLTSLHSPGANCERDDAVALDSLRDLITAPRQENCIIFQVPDVSLPEPVTEQSLLKTSTLTYVAGSLARNILKKHIKTTLNCKMCKIDCTGNQNELNRKAVFLIKSRQLENRKSLVYPSRIFYLLFHEVVNILTSVLPLLCHKANLKSILKVIITQNVNNPFLCKSHNMFEKIIDEICHFHLLTWSKNVNKILKGRDEDILTKDPIKIQAMNIHQVNKKIKTKIAQMKNLNIST